MSVQTLQFYSKMLNSARKYHVINNIYLHNLIFFSKMFSALKMEHINVEIKEMKLNCSFMFHFKAEKHCREKNSTC